MTRVWLEPHADHLLHLVRQARNHAGYEAAPHEIVFC